MPQEDHIPSAALADPRDDIASEPPDATVRDRLDADIVLPKYCVSIRGKF